jgi:hypothetical protein
MAGENKLIHQGINERRRRARELGELGELNDELKSEWAFWRVHRAGKVTLSDYKTITYPELLKLNAIQDMEDATKLADEGKEYFKHKAEQLKNNALGK